MKINPRPGKAAFTLIELMAVITIIVILASLVVGGLGYIQEKQAKSKATVQIALISKTLEEYKSDFGTYPLTADAADPKNSAILFKALYFDGFSDTTKATRIYLPDLDPATNKQGWTTGTASATTKITDPWGGEYRYRTAQPLTGTTPNKNTQNPDFDLWSVGKDGKTGAAATDKDDIRNF